MQFLNPLTRGHIPALTALLLMAALSALSVLLGVCLALLIGG